MTYGITLNGHAQDSADVKEVAEEAYRKLKALPGAGNVNLTGWVNETTGGSITLKNPPDEAEAPVV